MSEAIGESQLLIKTPDHQQLFVKQNRPLAPQAVLVVVHGLGGHQGRYDYLTNWFVAHYVAVYRYDHRGHGQTPGAHGVYGDFNHFPDDLKTVVDWAKKNTPHLPIFVVGHSLGGGTAMAFGAKYPATVNGIISVGALTRYHNQIFGPVHHFKTDETISGSFGDRSNSSAWMRKDYQDDPLNLTVIKGSLLNAALDLVAFNKSHAADFVDPVLVLHGAEDGVVSVDDSMDSYREIASVDKELHVYPCLRHQVLNEPSRRREVYQEILNWMKKHG
ncbi:lysophospholipase [Limosilactobacillus mucosae]